MRAAVLPLALGLAAETLAFSPSAPGLLRSSAPQLHSSSALRPLRAQPLASRFTMQEKSESSKAEVPSTEGSVAQMTKPVEEVEEVKTTVASQPPSQVEQNEFAAMALKAGFLKPNSPLLESTLVGNKGFDPLGFASSSDMLLQMREAELKHARLAMLAAVGWAMSEIIHPVITEFLQAKSFLQPAASGALEKAPSVLNGGLSEVPTPFWIVAFVFSGLVEITRMLQVAEKPKDFDAGNLGFDPLGFYSLENDKGKAGLRLKELNNGRLAMLAIAIFPLKELLFDSAIVKQDPTLFTQGPLANFGTVFALLGEYTGLFSCKSGLVYCADDGDFYKTMMEQNPSNSADYINSLLDSLYIPF